MVRRSLRDRVLTPQVARAMTSPSGIVLAGAGAAVAIASGVGAIGVVAAGVGAWVARVAVAVPRDPSPGSAIDPFALKEPWRRFVQQAIKAQRRFDGATRSAGAGPLRDRLDEIGQRLDDAVQECWRVAKQGQALSEARAEVDTTEADRELARYASTPVSPGSDAEQTVEALRAQVQAAKRIDDTIADARDRLRLLDARIDEAAARAVELSVSAYDATELGGLGDDVDGVVGDMEALRQGLEATERPAAENP